jgi:hypothetical protein
MEGLMTRYEKRLQAIALHIGLCPVHGERPVCVVRCDLIWEGTDAEEDELEALIDHAYEGVYRAWPPALRCRSCGDDGAVCLSCLEAAVAHWPLLAETPLNPEELARYETLAQHLRPKPRRGRSNDAV